MAKILATSELEAKESGIFWHFVIFMVFPMPFGYVNMAIHTQLYCFLTIGTACNAIYFFHSRNSGVKNKARCVIKVCEK